MSTCLELSQCCRCCMKRRSDKINIFVTLDEFASQICDLLVDCGGIIVTEDDAFSKSICSSCLTDLSNAVRFRERCLQTDGILKRSQFAGHELADADFIAEKLTDTEPIVDEHDQLENLYLGFPETEQLQQDSVADDTHHEYDENQLIVQSNLTPTVSDHDETTDVQQTEKVNDTKTYELGDNPEKKTNKKLSSHKKMPRHKSSEHKIKPTSKPAAGTADAPKYKCKFCNLTFATNNGCARHMRIHTGVRPFKCEICGEGFTLKGTLKRHKLIHSNV
ncbi:zinc finger protein 112-like [Topomyia yanbarensis]|uniref:zinc finger protein 112-like n=1 Tax=Topomyia yanbarensis TaxID=2498891 RepID=UPI00273B44B1|nr:zinc finger protein 112-like [Topomyia yanbarensis]